MSKLKTLLLIFLIFIAIAPILFAAIPGIENNQTYSIYNEGYDGYSIIANDLRTITEGSAPKYEVTNIISNLNVLNRFNGSGVLIIAGPSANFQLTETISLILYLLRGGSVVIIDDFGTGNDILDPIFDAFENIGEWSENNIGGLEFPSLNDVFASESTNEDPSDPFDGDPFSDPTQGASGDIASEIGGSFFTELIGNLILRFAFNRTGVLMDVGNNDLNPNRPLLTEIDETVMPGYTFTQGVSRVQMEMATIISIKLRVNALDENGNPVLDDNGENVKREVWQPLQKLSASLITGAPDTGNDDAFELSLPFFPMYSSRQSWIETDMDAAADGSATPDLDEWGNAKFATALTIPLAPGMGKLIFIADPSIFINRWTSQTTKNDNLVLFRNIIDMATDHQVIDADNPVIPVIFDFAHTFQGILSPALYSTALLKLIAEMSMFPLYAPFVPFAAYGYGKRLLPKNRRLRPILLTKRRGEGGASEFERKLEEIKDSGGYGEPIMHLSRRLVRTVQKDVRFEGSFAKDPKEMSQFFVDNFPNMGSRREIQSQLSVIFKIAENPTRRMTMIGAQKYLVLLKKLIDLLE